MLLLYSLPLYINLLSHRRKPENSQSQNSLIDRTASQRNLQISTPEAPNLKSDRQLPHYVRQAQERYLLERRILW